MCARKSNLMINGYIDMSICRHFGGKKWDIQNIQKNK